MTVASAANRNEYTAGASQTVFAYTFRILHQSHLAVYQAGTLLTLTTHYTVSGVGAAGGGNVTLVTGATAGQSIVIERSVPATQESDYVNGDALDANRLEDDLDKHTMLIQQILTRVGRAISVVASSLYANLTLPDPVSGKFLRWKADLTGLENVDVDTTGSISLPVAIASGGTAATTAAAARTNLSVPSTTEAMLWSRYGAKGDLLVGAADDSARIVAIGQQFQVPMVDTNSETSVCWRDVAPRGHLWGLTLSNNAADANSDLDIAVGVAASDDADDTDRYLLRRTTTLTKQLDATWAKGTNQGGRFSGVASSDRYHVILIRQDSTGDIDAGFTAANDPTGSINAPSGWSKRRRIGSIRTGASGVLAFSQDGDEFLLSAAVLDVNVTNPGTAAVLRTLTVPSGIKVRALINALKVEVTTNFGAYISSPDQSDQQASLTVAPLRSIGQLTLATTEATAAGLPVRTDTEGRVRTRQSASGADDIFRLATLGWIDRRGRDA